MLAVSSPRTTGPEVKEAQRLLKHNAFDEDFLEGDVDGTFGPETGRACKRAKYRLGFAKGNIEPNYGSTLERLLKGDRDLTEGMKKRRRERTSDRHEQIRQQALAFAKKNLGVEEHPAGTNKQKFGEWYGVNGEPWCAMFVSRCYDAAFGERRGFVKRGSRYAFVPFLMAAAVEGERGLDQTRNPQPGDIVCYQFDADENADHIGLFEKWTNKSAGRFDAIEGNTSSASNSNGGQVKRQHRTLSQVYRPRDGGLGFIRVVPLD
jgi:hypothetical protein